MQDLAGRVPSGVELDDLRGAEAGRDSGDALLGGVELVGVDVGERLTWVRAVDGQLVGGQVGERGSVARRLVGGGDGDAHGNDDGKGDGGEGGARSGSIAGQVAEGEAGRDGSAAGAGCQRADGEWCEEEQAHGGGQEADHEEEPAVMGAVPRRDRGIGQDQADDPGEQ